MHDEWVASERHYFSERSMAIPHPASEDTDATVGELEPVT
jgi:hypothetical protein